MKPALPRSGGQAEARRQLQPPGREIARFLGAAWLSHGAEVRAALLFLLPVALFTSNTQDQTSVLPPFH